MGWNVAVAGVTGAVGQEFLASSRSAGKPMTFMGKDYAIEELTAESFNDIDIALFSAGGAISKEFAPIAAKKGTIVVDNSSAFRMVPSVPLVVPEVNPHAIQNHHNIIANPNCSTIIALVPVWPLHHANPVRRMVASTYQAVSGAGWKAMQELLQQTQAVLNGQEPQPKAFKWPCAFNVFSHDSAIGEDGYNVEETKLVKETHKIFNNPNIAITATCVRVPVLRAHSESINLEFEEPMEVERAVDLLLQAPGVTVVDNWEENYFPMPIEASGQDDVLVGRIRQDLSIPGKRGLNIWISGDQLRKGAALNAVQIAELLV